MTLLSPLPPPFESSVWAGMRVGLLGGSFNPPHEGHVHISLAALKGLELDAVWWLVTPQNPLKVEKPLPLEERVALSEKLTKQYPQILVSDMEYKLGTQKTYDSVRAIKSHFPETQFVWISGTDTAMELHKWYRWKALLGEICMLHLARPPTNYLIEQCPLRQYKKQKHIILEDSAPYPLDSGKTYWMMQENMIDISSSKIRAKTENIQ